MVEREAKRNAGEWIPEKGKKESQKVRRLKKGTEERVKKMMEDIEKGWGV